MRIFGGLSVLLVLLLASCARKGIQRSDPPDDLLSKDSMIIVLKELSCLESATQVKYTQPLRYKKDLELSSDSLFRSLRIDSSRFNRSMRYYSEYQLDMKEIYAAVLDSINLDLEREKQRIK